MPKPIWITTSGFLTTASELISFSTSVVATGTNITYSLISGELPFGLSFTNGVILGIPNAVNNKTRSTFVVRAANNFGVADRLFSIDVEGSDPPIWITPEGFLPAGYYEEIYIFNDQYINFQLSATPYQSSNVKLKYFISDNSGILPNGLILNKDGLISGYVNEEIQPGDFPKRFTFNVTVTDGISSSSRSFKLMVFNSDYFRRDTGNYTVAQVLIVNTLTTQLINAGTNLFRVGIELPSSFPIDLINPFDIFTFPYSLPQGARIVNITNDSIEIDGITWETEEPGAELSILRTNIGYNVNSGNPVAVSDSYLLPPQFVKGTDLGVQRANNNTHIDVRAYNPEEFRGSIIYSEITGTGILNQIPEGLRLDPSGYIYGFIPYQPAYIKNYNITIKGTKTDNSTQNQTVAVNTFTLAIKGEIESSIEWISTGSLGTILTGETSELSVVAKQVSSAYTVKYQLTSGSLPPGLTLARDGSLYGQVEYGNTGTYIFTVMASDVYELSQIEKEFNIKVIEDTNKEFTKIYMRPFLVPQKRRSYQDFILNTFTFDPNLMYRYFDPNFGVQTEIKITLEFGIEQLNLINYLPALRKNFYKRRFYFGDIKKAIAKDKNGIIVYEVVYIDIVDNMVNSQNISVGDVIYANNEIYYPSSIDNMRDQLESVVLEDNSYIEIDDLLQPRFMRTFQQGQYELPQYISVFPICYALPGQGSRIISRIKLSGFNFKTLDLEIDRIIVAKPKDYSVDKYLIVPRQSITDFIETDQYLFGEDWALPPEFTVRLDDENNQPLGRN